LGGIIWFSLAAAAHHYYSPRVFFADAPVDPDLSLLMLDYIHLDAHWTADAWEGGQCGHRTFRYRFRCSCSSGLWAANSVSKCSMAPGHLVTEHPFGIMSAMWWLIGGAVGPSQITVGSAQQESKQQHVDTATAHGHTDAKKCEFT